jgi:arsenate reductase-like glutaredoxin family protein
MTCGKTQGFLAKAKIDTVEQVDAKKVRMGPEQALAVLKDVDELYVAKGSKVVHLDLKKGRPDRATLLGLLLGPSGNLRAPTLRKGRILLVGFDAPTYKAVLR